MFVLVAIIRPPPAKNFDHVLAVLFSFIYQDEKRSLYEIRLRQHRPFVFRLLFGLMYLSVTLLMFLAFAYAFYIAGLPLTSVVFDTFTIALTVFAAVTIRNKAKELTVNEKTTLPEFLLDMFSIPVAKVGSFLAAKWKEYNIVAIFFSFIIETPFSLVMQFIEGWSQFLKDRRAEIR